MGCPMSSFLDELALYASFWVSWTILPIGFLIYRRKLIDICSPMEYDMDGWVYEDGIMIFRFGT